MNYKGETVTLQWGSSSDKVNINSNKLYWCYVSLIWYAEKGRASLFVAFLPKMYNLNLNRRKHQKTKTKRYSTKYLTSTFQNCQDLKRQGKTGTGRRLRRQNDYRQQESVDWVLEQKKDLSRKTDNILVKATV